MKIESHILVPLHHDRLRTFAILPEEELHRKIGKWKFGRDPRGKKSGAKATERHVRDALSLFHLYFDKNGICLQLGHNIFLAEKHFAGGTGKQGRKIVFFFHKDRLEC